ncbi:glutaminase A [Micrococcoides hystricis]|uniref:Glutaminase n=1 Tax=Micrococcoides hystricis TaxID=1572761 RepID=A0ABV6P894_9MICC
MRSPVQQYLDDVHAGLVDELGGSTKSKNPELAQADPMMFGMAITTADGYTYASGDADVPFSIQSISKVFGYALALQDRGFVYMDERIDVEPSGDPFNEISLDAETGKPKNPLINAGAIAATAQIRSTTKKSAFDRILEVCSAAAGRELELNQKVYEYDRDTGKRNRALAWLLASSEIIEGDPIQAFDDYSRQCSISVTTKDLSVMAATLANLGTNPITGQDVFDTEVVQRVLSVMLTCGMYDDSGDWVSTVGLPAKSGVGGGILGALPGQLGLASFSPPLDQHGSSVRGLRAYKQISTDLELHFVRTSKAGLSTIRTQTTVDKYPSTVRRPDAAKEVLEEYGHKAHVIEVMGDLLFSGAEVVSRTVTNLDSDSVCVVLDMSRTDEIPDVSVDTLSRLSEVLADEETALGLVDPHDRLDGLRVPLDMEVKAFGTRNAALEWAEYKVLKRYGSPECFPASSVKEYPLLSVLSDEAAETIRAELVDETYDDGEVIRKIGQVFDGLWFISSGRIETLTAEEKGKRRRLALLTPGMTFGESALDERTHQVATIRAVTPVKVKHFSKESIEKVTREHPEVMVEFWRAVAAEAMSLVSSPSPS